MTWSQTRSRLIDLGLSGVEAPALATAQRLISALETLGAPAPPRSAERDGGIALIWSTPWTYLEIYADGEWDWVCRTHADDQLESLSIHLGRRWGGP